MKFKTSKITRGIAVLVLGSSFLAGCYDDDERMLTAAEQAFRDDAAAKLAAEASVAAALTVAASVSTPDALDTAEPVDVDAISANAVENAEPAPV